MDLGETHDDSDEVGFLVFGRQVGFCEGEGVGDVGFETLGCV